MTEKANRQETATFATNQPHSRPAGPHWNKDSHQLLWRRRLVKQFCQPADAQETILAAFEELGWPFRMDDPLPPKSQQDPKQRLHDTIKRLNRYHLREAIRFHGDGTGTGIYWERSAPPVKPR
jgi:hypothetical protein